MSSGFLFFTRGLIGNLAFIRQRMHDTCAIGPYAGFLFDETAYFLAIRRERFPDFMGHRFHIVLFIVPRWHEL